MNHQIFGMGNWVTKNKKDFWYLEWSKMSTKWI